MAILYLLRCRYSLSSLGLFVMIPAMVVCKGACTMDARTVVAEQGDSRWTCILFEYSKKKKIDQNVKAVTKALTLILLGHQPLIT